jgi:hypothetical protein
MPGGVPDGCDHELQVPVVQAGQGVAQADGAAGGDAGGEFEDPAFAAAEGELAVVQGAVHGERVAGGPIRVI